MCCLHCVSALFQRSGYALILAIEDQIDDQASRKAANTDRICQQTGPKHQAAANAKNNAHNGISLALQKPTVQALRLTTPTSVANTDHATWIGVPISRMPGSIAKTNGATNPPSARLMPKQKEASP